MVLCSVSIVDNQLISIRRWRIALSSRRSRVQMSQEVFTAIANGEDKPTRIMYACNLSWSSLLSILSLLESMGFIDDVSVDSDRKSYCVTAKGGEVIRYYDGLQALINV